MRFAKFSVFQISEMNVFALEDLAQSLSWNMQQKYEKTDISLSKIILSMDLT